MLRSLKDFNNFKFKRMNKLFLDPSWMNLKFHCSSIFRSRSCKNIAFAMR